MPKRYSLADVRRSYPRDKAWQEMTGALPAYLLYRPPSFVISHAALRLGLPAIAVTWLGLGLALAILFAAVSGGKHAHLWIAGLGIAFHVLDCVDGNMARTTGRSTRFGALLDGFADSVFFTVLLFSLGLLVEREDAHAWSRFGVEIGLASNVLVLLNRKVRDHYTLLTGMTAVLDGEAVARPSLAQWALYAVLGLEHLYAPAIALGASFDALWLLLLAIAGYSAVVSMGAVWLTLSAARSLDRNQPDA